MRAAPKKKAVISIFDYVPPSVSTHVATNVPQVAIESGQTFANGSGYPCRCGGSVSITQHRSGHLPIKTCSNSGLHPRHCE
jgi:hypothetical protein